MSWDRAAFKRAYVADGGSPNSANSYVSYLNRAERVIGTLGGVEGAVLLERAERLPDAAWGGVRERSDSMSALRCFVRLGSLVTVLEQPVPVPVAPASVNSLAAMALLAEAQNLGSRYYRLTGKPLGVTGEIAEFEATRHLGLRLCDARTPGYDAIDPIAGTRVQIKGRAIDPVDRYRGMCPAIKCGKDGNAFDMVALVLLDRATLQAIEIWTAELSAIQTRIAGLESMRRRENGTLAITQFISIADRTFKAG